MASGDLVRRFDTAVGDLEIVEASSNFGQIRNMSALSDAWAAARNLANVWIARTTPVKERLDDGAFQQLVVFLEAIIAIGAGQRGGLTVQESIQRATAEFQTSLPLMVYGLLEAKGIADLSTEDLPRKTATALQEIAAAVTEADKHIEQRAVDAVADLERAKAKANSIVVTAAETQFRQAANWLR